MNTLTAPVWHLLSAGGDLVRAGARYKWRQGEKRRCGINRSWTDGAIRTCETWQQEDGKKKQKKKRKLSGADSAWLLVKISWSQQAGERLSDKVESILSDPKEPALWWGQQVAKWKNGQIKADADSERQRLREFNEKRRWGLHSKTHLQQSVDTCVQRRQVQTECLKSRWVFHEKKKKKNSAHQCFILHSPVTVSLKMEMKPRINFKSQFKVKGKCAISQNIALFSLGSLVTAFCEQKCCMCVLSPLAPGPTSGCTWRYM